MAELRTVTTTVFESIEMADVARPVFKELPIATLVSIELGARARGQMNDKCARYPACKLMHM